jgi:hypothetical protein
MRLILTQRWYRRFRHAHLRQAGVDMQNGLLSRIIDRIVANTQAIRATPEAIILLVVVGMGTSAFGVHHYRERLADLNGRVDIQDRLLTEYRTKLTEAETRVGTLITALG